MLMEVGLAAAAAHADRRRVEPFGDRFGPQPRAELEAFLFDRLRGLLQERGYATLEVEAVVSLAPARNRSRPRHAGGRARVSLLPAGPGAWPRQQADRHILKKTPRAPPISIRRCCRTGRARALVGLRAGCSAGRGLLAAGDYSACCRRLAPLKEPVDGFSTM